MRFRLRMKHCGWNGRLCLYWPCGFVRNIGELQSSAWRAATLANHGAAVGGPAKSGEASTSHNSLVDLRVHILHSSSGRDGRARRREQSEVKLCVQGCAWSTLLLPGAIVLISPLLWVRKVFGKSISHSQRCQNCRKADQTVRSPPFATGERRNSNKLQQAGAWYCP